MGTRKRFNLGLWSAAAVLLAAALASRVSANLATDPIRHPLPIATRPALPALRTPQPFPTAVPAQAFIAGRRAVYWRLDRKPPTAPLRNAPKLSHFLRKTGKHTWSVLPQIAPSAMSTGRKRPYAANGNTIVLTGSASNYLFNDVTLPYGADVYITCEGLPSNQNARYAYYVYPPDGSGAEVSATVSSDSNGVCSSYGHFNLSTPFGGYGSTTVNGSAYPGVWIAAIYDKTAGQFVTEIAIVSEASINFGTYSNLGLTTPSYNFSAGGNFVINATGLNAAHSYAFGFVDTSVNGQPCLATIPSGAQNQTAAVCFTGKPTGLQAYGGALTESLGPSTTPSTNGAPTGTYDIELYDTTAGEMLGQQQISVGSNAAWTLTPYNSSGATPPPGFNYNNTFASDGLIDQSVTGLTYAATGLSLASGAADLTISDPNGVILNGGAYGSCYCTKSSAGYDLPNETPAIPIAVAGSAFSKQVAFPLNSALNEAFGPTQTPFAPNVFTAQVYNPSNTSEVASEAFQILGYYATYAWQSGTIQSAGTTPTTATVTITNSGGSNYGAWNGDAISGVQLSTTAANGEILGSDRDDYGYRLRRKHLDARRNRKRRQHRHHRDAGLAQYGHSRRRHAHVQCHGDDPERRLHDAVLGRHADPARARHRVQCGQRRVERSRSARLGRFAELDSADGRVGGAIGKRDRQHGRTRRHL